MQERFTRADEIDLKTGEFPMVLATEGEATDGHILSIRGGVLPESLPLQLSHVNDPGFTLGSIRGFEKDTRATPARLRAVGQIELEGPNADARKDLAFMVSKGHVNRVSIRWDGIKATQRVDLDKDHPAYVSKDDPDWRKRSGMFFEEWRALEGSLVAVPADAEAVIGRALKDEDPWFARLAADCVDTRDLLVQMDRLRVEHRNLREEFDELLDLCTERFEDVPTKAPASGDGEGEEELRVVSLSDAIRDELAKFRTGLRADAQKIVDTARGKVT